MDPSLEEIMQQRLYVFLIAAAIGLFNSWVAWISGFYRFRFPPSLCNLVNVRIVIGAFALFFFVELIAVPSIYLLWLSFKQGAIALEVQPDQENQGWINLLSIFCTALALGLYYKSMDKSCRGQIWGEGNPPSKSWRFISNLALGAVTWLIAYPLIIALGQVIDVVEQFSYHGPRYRSGGCQAFERCRDGPVAFLVIGHIGGDHCAML